MNEELYSEKVHSNGTTALFVILSVIFLSLFAWRYSSAGWDFLTGLLLFLAFLFIFYIFNYRTLRIRCANQFFSLQFGLVRWRTAYSSIQDVQLDDSPWWIKYGGAGVHFAMVNEKYRAYFNFLEYPRVLVTLREKQGPVRQLCFTTRCPDQVINLLQKESV